jgi:epsilon-lactone hydrolase
MNDPHGDDNGRDPAGPGSRHPTGIAAAVRTRGPHPRAFARQAAARTPDPFAVPAAALRMVVAYLATIHARACDVCILDTDLTGFPPTMIRVGSTEILLDDARDLADQLTAAGVDTRLHVWRGQLHVFPALYRLVRHARTALQLSGTFLTDTAARPRPQPDQLFPA